MFELLNQLKTILNISYKNKFDYASTISYLSKKMISSKDDFDYALKVRNEDIQGFNFSDFKPIVGSHNNKTAFIITGAIGSGKSTLVQYLYLNGFFVNDIEFLYEDLIKKTFFGDVVPQKKAYNYAKAYLSYKLKNVLSNGQDFVFELVPSNSEKINILQTIKNCGYKLVSIYLCTDNEEINLSRVQKRMSYGADFVSEEKVKSRISLLSRQLNKIVSASDVVYIVNSLDNGFKLIGYSDNSNIIMLDK